LTIAIITESILFLKKCGYTIGRGYPPTQLRSIITSKLRNYRSAADSTDFEKVGYKTAMVGGRQRFYRASPFVPKSRGLGTNAIGSQTPGLGNDHSPRYRDISSKKTEYRRSSDSRRATRRARSWISSSSSSASSSLGGARWGGSFGAIILSLALTSSGVGSRMLVFRRVTVALLVGLAHLLLNRGSRANLQLNNVEPVMAPKWPLYLPLKIHAWSPTCRTIVKIKINVVNSGIWREASKVTDGLPKNLAGRRLSSCHANLVGLRQVMSLRHAD
jgi:hypothetical protein